MAMTTSQPPRYRLINAALEPHPHLDDEFVSLSDALDAAIRWSQRCAGDPIMAAIGVEVSTGCGSWRTLQLPSSAAALSI